MVQKVFALASVTALSGIVVALAAAGCTSDGVGPVDDAGSAADVRKDRTAPPVDGDGGGPDEEKCFKEDPLDVSGEKYQSPRVQPGACTDNVFKVIDDLVAVNKNATFDDLKSAIVAEESTTCAECVFGEDGDTWAPIVQSGGKVVALNGGGCVDLVSEKADCGKAYYQWDLCLATTCKDCSGSERSACTQGAQSTACKDASDALTAACGDNVNSYLSACFKAGEVTVKGPIREQCVRSTVKDASTD